MSNLKQKLLKIKHNLLDSINIFKGKKKAVTIHEKNINFINRSFTKEEIEYLNNLKINFYFSEFGKDRVNSGGELLLNESRLNPTLKSIREYFPNANIIVYTDFDIKEDNIKIIKIEQSPFTSTESEHKGYHIADYYKFYALANATGDFNCVMDSDMEIVSSNITALIEMTRKFGFCVPHNNRQSMVKDMRLSQNTIEIDDKSNGLGYSYNQSPMTIWKDNARGREFYNQCCKELLKLPSKASFSMWKAAWETGIYPYILPKEWCLCIGDEGIGDEVILHIGHDSVKKYYNR
ncbi:hypothetical protein [Chishuiella changwenlii]|uniref:hypothetical protein n=1 Tax=Chishuiella changwenlii TaxID=1434701 RepID=UPI002FD934BB